MTTLNIIEQVQNEIAEVKAQIEAKQSEINSFEYSCTEQEFDEYLDDGGEEKTSVGTFYPSDILKSCDLIAYRCAKSNYESNYDVSDCADYRDLEAELQQLEEHLENLEKQLEELEVEQDKLDSLKSEE